MLSLSVWNCLISRLKFSVIYILLLSVMIIPPLTHRLIVCTGRSIAVLSRKRDWIVMSEEKANQRETLKIPMDKVRKFAPNATDNQLEDFVLKACDYYQRYLKRQRDRER